MSGSTNPSISAVTSHLSVFQQYKYSQDEEDRLTLSDFECDSDDSDEEEDDNRRPPELRAGDYILFYDGGHHGNGNPRKLIIDVKQLKTRYYF